VTRGRSWAAWAASLAVATGLLAYFLRGVEASRILDTAQNASPGPFLAFLGLFATGVAARTTRFWILLGRTLPFRAVLGITLVRNLLVDLLPARLGELSYVYLVTTRGKRPLEDGVATLAIAFLLDLVALSPLVLAALLIVGGGTLVPASIAWTAGGALAGSGIVAVLAAGPMSRRLGDWLGRTGTARWTGAMAARLRALGTSFEQARHNGVLVPAAVGVGVPVLTGCSAQDARTTSTARKPASAEFRVAHHLIWRSRTVAALGKAESKVHELDIGHRRTP
jgi:hypothetical protein